MLDFLLDAGSIGGICGGIATVLGALGVFIWKIKKSPKTWKEWFSDIINNKSKEIQELVSSTKEPISKIKNIVKNEVEKKKDGKKAV